MNNHENKRATTTQISISAFCYCSYAFCLLFSFGFSLCLIPCSVCIHGALIIVIKFDSVTELNMAAIIRYHLLVKLQS